MNNKGNRQKKDEIFEEELEVYDESSNSQEQSKQIENKQRNISGGQEEGQILQEEYSHQNIPHYLPQSELKLQAINKNQDEPDLYQDSSEQNNDRLEREKKKRQEYWKSKQQKGQQAGQKKKLTESQLLEIAFNSLQKTNKKVMLMRKKNEKRMQDLQKIRITQQPYLTTSNTHFRGSSSEYAIITQDPSGKAYLHPNHSFRVGQMKLQNFILKNIKEESTANYLNEVVKFENYAYQQRKKRRHHIE